jgi:hypothetical protein
MSVAMSTERLASPKLSDAKQSLHSHYGYSASERDAENRIRRTIIGLMIFGLVLRLVHYLQNYPMWCDETMLAANLLDRGLADLVQPLDYRQVCPVGFLALEWVCVRTVGFCEASLRFIPALAALLSVPLFYLLARRTLGRGTQGLLLAVALFAVSESLIRYAAEVKPYATDLLFSLVLLNLAELWRRSPERAGRMWALAAVSPLALAISLPAVFIIGTIAAVGLWEIRARRKCGLMIAYGGFLAAAGLSVAILAGLGQYQTLPGDRAYFLRYWAAAFPPSWTDPRALVSWFIHTHTGPMFACFGGGGIEPAWITALSFGCFVVGIGICARHDSRRALLLVLPLVLTFLAAVLRRYPYGMSVRTVQFLVPPILLLASAGAAWLCSRRRKIPGLRWIIPALVALSVGIGLWRLGRDLGHPYWARWHHTSREFARWFWNELAVDGELVCVRTDLGIPFRPGRWQYDGADQYLCHQRIYSERHRRGLPPRWAAVSAARPLRCVLLNRMPGEVPAFERWIETHRDRYRLGEVRTYHASRGSALEPSQTYVVCEFTPLSPAK